jgi:hypothetical protein
MTQASVTYYLYYCMLRNIALDKVLPGNVVAYDTKLMKV